MAWMNNDGLYLKYGTERTVPNVAGDYRTVGALREIEIKLNATMMKALTTANTIVSDVTELPAGVVVEEVEVVATTVATTGSSAALNLGTIRKDRTTVIDADGLLEAAAVTTIDAAGEKTVYRAPVSGTGVGDQIGVATTYPCYIIASTSTGTFTDGAVTIRIKYKVV